MLHQDLYNKMVIHHSDNTPSGDILKDVTNEFPYFSAAHFFLLKETKSTDKDYVKIAAKTSLHFNNPFLLNFQLNKKINTPVTLIIEEEINPVVEAPIPEILNQVETKAAVNETELIFEPLYTTDYFASQGIKLREEAQPSDKLGKQLKSFTEWLKTMKKVNEGKLPAGNVNMDLAVQNLAEKSNKEQEILTESMAEVYLQQGKPKKALDIYEKLSLLNPAKSAYFAAKIELLKEN